MVVELNTAGVAVNLACNTLEVSRSGYYAWLDRPESERSKENAILLSRIQAVHEKSDQTYGSPRMTVELQAAGLPCSENRVVIFPRKSGHET
jgi:putative transposase